MGSKESKEKDKNKAEDKDSKDKNSNDKSSDQSRRSKRQDKRSKRKNDRNKSNNKDDSESIQSDNGLHVKLSICLCINCRRCRDEDYRSPAGSGSSSDSLLSTGTSCASAAGLHIAIVLPGSRDAIGSAADRTAPNRTLCGNEGASRDADDPEDINAGQTCTDKGRFRTAGDLDGNEHIYILSPHPSHFYYRMTAENYCPNICT